METTRFAQAYSTVLTPTQREALRDACCFLVDLVVHDTLIAESEDTQEYLQEFLPALCRHRYDRAFWARFLVAMLSVGWKLAQPRRIALSSLAEELALNAIVDQADGLLGMSTRQVPDFEEFRSVAFQDWDFELLFDPTLDGIQQTKRGERAGMTGVEFREWFVPFANAPRVHRYLFEDCPSSYMDE